MKSSPTLSTALFVALLALSTSTGWSDDATGSHEDLIPWALLVDEDDGAAEGIDVGGRGIQVVRIPIAYTLISRDDRNYGLRVTVPISFGFHELTVDTVQDGKLRENLSTMTILPGLEWQLPLTDRGVFKPFFEIGLGSDLGSSNSAWIYSVGSRLLRSIGKEESDLFFGARLQYSGSSVRGVGETEAILVGEIGIERMFGLGWTLRDQKVNIGIYSLAHYNFTEIRLRELDDSLTSLRSTALELGISIGTEGDTVVLGMRLPRIGLSYRSSGNFRSWRINFGFPF